MLQLSMSSKHEITQTFLPATGAGEADGGGVFVPAAHVCKRAVAAATGSGAAVLDGLAADEDTLALGTPVVVVPAVPDDPCVEDEPPPHAAAATATASMAEASIELRERSGISTTSVDRTRTCGRIRTLAPDPRTTPW